MSSDASSTKEIINRVAICIRDVRSVVTEKRHATKYEPIRDIPGPGFDEKLPGWSAELSITSHITHAYPCNSRVNKTHTDSAHDIEYPIVTWECACKALEINVTRLQ